MFGILPVPLLPSSLPGVPLVMIHVALVPDLAYSMAYINAHTGAFWWSCVFSVDLNRSAPLGQNYSVDRTKTAIFYSISTSQPGLQVVGHCIDTPTFTEFYLGY